MSDQPRDFAEVMRVRHGASYGPDENLRRTGRRLLGPEATEEAIGILSELAMGSGWRMPTEHRAAVRFAIAFMRPASSQTGGGRRQVMWKLADEDARELSRVLPVLDALLRDELDAGFDAFQPDTNAFALRLGYLCCELVRHNQDRDESAT